MKDAPVASEINDRIARRVRSLRSEQGLTLEALAARTSVSRSMISLIERGESSPTAVVLERIAAGLGVPLASLFDDETAEPDPVARAAARTPWRDPETGYVRRNLSPPNFPSPLQLVEVVLPAGARVAYETAERGSCIHQQIWVLEGALEIRVGGEVYQLQQDDCLAMQLNAPTAFHNRTRRATRYVVALATGGVARARS